MNILTQAASFIVSRSIFLLVSFLTGIRAKFEGDIAFTPERKVYFANHNSHADFIMVQLALPKRWRKAARPVAGADYWLKGAFRRFVSKHVFNSLLIMRNGNDPKAITRQMSDVLATQSSLIIFPEGTRTADRIAMHKAAFYIAINFAKNMNCVAIKMDPKSLKKGQVWYDTPEVRMKYDLYELCALDLTGFEPDRPNPIRVRKLYEKISNLYEKENL